MGSVNAARDAGPAARSSRPGPGALYLRTSHLDIGEPPQVVVPQLPPPPEPVHLSDELRLGGRVGGEEVEGGS